MKLPFAFLMLITLLASARSMPVLAREIHVVDADHPLDRVPEADAAWQARDQQGKTEEALALWEGALKQNAGRGTLYIPLTKASSRAYRHALAPEKKLHWAGTARRYGALAIEKNPDSPQAHAAYAEALGQWAQANKGVGSLKFVKQAVAELETSISLDSHYDFAHMLLANFYEKSPGVISVGDKAKALEQAKLAVEYGGDRAINRVTLAKIYIARGDKAAAKDQLEKAIALSAPADAIPETKSDQDDARKLLKSL